jgi:Cu2+-exporting ATPase
MRPGALAVEAALNPSALSSAGTGVVMVGDGINDAPVSARASIAIGSASALAQAKAISSSRRSRCRRLRASWSHVGPCGLRQNLACGRVHLAAIPLLPWADPPWLAAIGMSLSRFVVLNARRIAARSAEAPAIAELGTREAIA